MACVVVVGAQWGDEGKGKVVDLLSERADVVVRYGGGANAGHTLVVGGAKIVTHLVPSGVLHPGKRCLLGDGMVIDHLSRDPDPSIRVSCARAAWIRRATGGDPGVLDRLQFDVHPEVRAIASWPR